MNIHLIKGDITQLTVDAIVNAANSSLEGGGGVDGAIHSAGGPKILQECMEIRNKQGGCKTGTAVITSGGNLRVKYVIQAVGPVWNGGNNNEENFLASAYLNSLLIGVQNSIESIAFPNISTGIYGFPKPRAAEIAINTLKNFKGNTTIRDAYFVCYDNENYRLYKSLL